MAYTCVSYYDSSSLGYNVGKCVILVELWSLNIQEHWSLLKHVEFLLEKMKNNTGDKLKEGINANTIYTLKVIIRTEKLV